MNVKEFITIMQHEFKGIQDEFREIQYGFK